LHFQFPDEIENTKSLRERGKQRTEDGGADGDKADGW